MLEKLSRLFDQGKGSLTIDAFAVLAPGGGGGLPINPKYVLCRNAGRVLLCNFEGKIFEYPETADGQPCGQPPQKRDEPELV